MSDSYTLAPIAFVRSSLKRREDAPKQGNEGAPHAWLELSAAVAEGIEGISEGEEIVVIT